MQLISSSLRAAAIAKGAGLCAIAKFPLNKGLAVVPGFEDKLALGGCVGISGIKGRPDSIGIAVVYPNEAPPVLKPAEAVRPDCKDEAHVGICRIGALRGGDACFARASPLALHFRRHG